MKNPLKFILPGIVTLCTGFSSLQGAPLYSDTVEDNGARLLNALDGSNVSLVSSTPTPQAVGFVTWTLTYTVSAGASVIGQDLGFWAKFETGANPDAAKGYAFDNFSVNFTALP